jgi:CRISPR-associated protein Csm4
VLDEARLPLAAFTEALDALGKTGYGRDASIGLGKFERVGEPDVPAWQSRAAKSWLALAPLAPQNLGFDAGASFYQVKTHFGRHGDTVATGENPFKRPLLTARTGAVFSLPEAAETLFLGRGIGGVSIADARAVHQGYAPVMPLPDMPKPQEGLQ